MSDAALLAAIRAAPDDDAPRLVYADWLDEHAQPARAEFIRVQCELARTETPALREREAKLLAAHHHVFAGPLATPGVRCWVHRGFTGRRASFHGPLPRSGAAWRTATRQRAVEGGPGL